MANKEYDVVVIGAGPGGSAGAIRARQLGMKTACIEKNKTLGGTCLNVGCIPSKALLQSTEYYDWLLKEGREHGVEVDQAFVNFPQMMKRKEKVVESLVNGVAGLFKRNNVDRIEGEARLISAHQIEIINGSEKQTIETKHIILATGSESIALPFLPFDEKIVLSSTGALALPAIPKKMLVVGAGVIGVELASVYNRLGAQVTIVEMLDKITPAMDHAVSKMLQQILKKQGLDFHLSAKVLKGEVRSSGIALTVQENQQELTMEGDVVLVAVGRKPYTKGLGLSEAGVKVNRQGFVEVDGSFRTSQDNVYAIGDIIDGPMLAHKASEEAVAAVEIIAGLKPHVNYMAIPNVIYTHPEVAALGMTEEEARQAGLELIIGICAFRANARARCLGYIEGMVKVIADKQSGKLVGMHIMGPHASEMIGEGVAALEMGMTLEQLAAASHAHPTLAEAIKEAALQGLGRAINL